MAGSRASARNCSSAAASQSGSRLLGLLAASVADTAPRASSPLQGLDGEPALPAALRQWLSSAPPDHDRQKLVLWLSRGIALIDRLLCNQVNAIIHHPRFQRLEAAWRGLQYLVGQVDDDQRIQIKAMDVSAKHLADDQLNATEFDQSDLFRKIYTDTFSMPGAYPFSVLIGDYEVQLEPPVPEERGGTVRSHGRLDARTLAGISKVATAAFCPFVMSASPELFGIDQYGQLEYVSDPSRVFQEKTYHLWQKLRTDAEHARFVGLTLPRVLMRLPYEDDGTRTDGFRFCEQVAGTSYDKYLWGNAAFAFAGVLVRSFSQSGWLADIRGVRPGEDGGGLVTGLPAHYFTTDPMGVANKTPTDVIVTDELEKHLSELGFIPLCRCKDTELAAFYTTPSIQKPQRYDRLSATLNAKISAMLQYVFCVSRFAHYLKVIARDQVGGSASAAELERRLNAWLAKYVNLDPTAGPQERARLPLRRARVRVEERMDQPGSHDCIMQLWPHYALDELTGTIQLKTTWAPAPDR